MKSLDLDIYPVSEIIIYNVIHNRHKQQREEYLKKQRSTTLQDQEARRKHMNSRRNDVSNEHYFLFLFLFTNFIIL